MTDEFDKLRKGLRAAAPAPDADAKARAMKLAMENFDRHQETAATMRPMSDRHRKAGFLTGVRTMISRLTSRQALTATASVAALGIAIAIYPQLQRGPGLPVPEAARPEPMAAAPADKPPVPEAEATSLAKTANDLAPTGSPASPPAAPTQDLRREKAVEGRSALEAAPAEGTILAEDDAAIAANEPSFAAPPSPAGSKAKDEGTLGIVASPAPAIADSYAPAQVLPEPSTEAYPEASANPVKIVAEEPVSTFSIDTDTASYSVIRSSLAAGALPPKDAVRIEEMVNYFPYGYVAPEAGEAPFRAALSLFQTPWNPDTQLLRIGIQGVLPAMEDRPPLNLVFLIDTSGSMEDPNKLPLLKQSFRLMLGQLRPEDRVAIVTYAGSAGLVLEPTAASDQQAVLGALDRLSAGGSTAGQEGLAQAYAEAEKMGGEGRVSRILLATDGDFNVGISDPGELKDFIAKKRESGIYLSVLGFGRGNLDDATMQALAQNGNGTAAYIDTLSEAQKVLVDQLSGALFPIADDVKIQVEFNPAAVAEYRLIGYETRALAREDFNNDRVDAGEIGAGHQVTALYEVTPVGSAARLSDPLRYGAAPAKGDASELGFLKLRYKAPGATTSTLIETPIPATPSAPDTDARFAAAIAGMGQLLSEPKYLGDWGWDQAIDLASGARGDDPFGYRAEAVNLMRLAQSLSR